MPVLNRASKTAMGTALHRAAHQLFDRPVVFEDPLALKVIGAEGEAWLAERRPVLSSAHGANARAFVAVRSRFAEDCLREATARGVRQYVLLGAGFDTFAFRNHEPELLVFELDHPATQELKRERLASAGLVLPPTLRLEPIDFEREAVTVALERAGFDFGRPAQISWLGVSLYLEPEAVLALLGTLVRSLAEGSEIVFDYACPASLLAPARRAVFEAMARESKQMGEPYQSSFEPADLAARVAALGRSRIDMFGPKELNLRYLAGRADGVALQGPGHIARVGSF